MKRLKTSPDEHTDNNTGTGARKSPALAPLTKVTASRTACVGIEIARVIFMGRLVKTSSRAHGARTEGRENKSKPAKPVLALLPEGLSRAKGLAVFS